MGICSKIQGSLYFLWLQSGWNAAGGKSLDQMGRTPRLEVLAAPRVCSVSFDLRVVIVRRGAVLLLQHCYNDNKNGYFKSLFNRLRVSFILTLSIFKLLYIFFPHAAPTSNVSPGRP